MRMQTLIDIIFGNFRFLVAHLCGNIKKSEQNIFFPFGMCTRVYRSFVKINSGLHPTRILLSLAENLIDLIEKKKFLTTHHLAVNNAI